MLKKKQKTEDKKRNNIQSILSKYKIDIPKTTPQIMRAFFKDYHEPSGIMKLDDEHYSVVFEYQDISFAKANEEEQINIFLRWVDYLHSFNYENHIQVIHAAKPVKTEDYKQQYIYKSENLEGNKLKTAKEFNSFIESSLGDREKVLCETRQIAISIKAENFKEAQDIFMQYQLKTEEKFKELKSKIRRVNINERLEFLYDIFNYNLLKNSNITNIIEYAKENNLSVYDVIAPKEEVSFKEKNYIKIGINKYIRVMYVSKLSTSITPCFYNRLTTIQDGNVIVTLNITPKDSGKVQRMIDKKISGMKTERLEKVKRAIKNNYNYEVAKDEKLEDNIENAKELRDALYKKKQKLFANNILICIQAESLAELEEITKKVQSIGNEFLITIYNLDWQQLEGLQNTLPFAWNTIQFQRSLTSEATVANVPFNTKDLMQPNSIYYGINLISKNPVFIDRKKLLNGNGCYLATSGAGKSFMVKSDIEQVLLRYPEDEIIVIDPQRRIQGFNGCFWRTNNKDYNNRRYLH